MDSLAHLLEEAVARRDSPRQMVVPDELSEDVDDWTRKAIQRLKAAAPAHLAFLKQETTRSWKLSKSFLMDEERLVARFDVARQLQFALGPTIVMHIACCEELADPYTISIEVRMDASKSAIAESIVRDVGMEVLSSSEQLFCGVIEGLKQFSYRSNERSVVNEEAKMNLSSSLTEALDEGAEGAAFDPERFARKAAVSRKLGDIENRKHAKPAAPPPKKEGGIAHAVRKGMKMVFGKWVKSKDIDEATLMHLDEARPKVGSEQWAENFPDEFQPWAPKVLAALAPLAKSNYWAKSADRSKAMKEASIPDKMIRWELVNQIVWDDAIGEEWKGKQTPEPPSSKKEDEDSDENILRACIAHMPPDERADLLKRAGLSEGKTLEAYLRGEPVVFAESRLNLAADGSGVSSERTNPTKSGPVAERSNVLKQAKTGIERMITALDTVRGWLKELGVPADKDKSGAAAAALRKAADEIGKVEATRIELATIFGSDLSPVVGADVQQMMAEALARVGAVLLIEADDKKAKAKEGLARMIDGLRQLQGMLRQAKLSSRILDQVDAAINGLKMTRDGLDSMKTEDVQTNWNEVPYNWKKVKASEVKKGHWINGGGDRLRQVVDLVSDGAGVTFTFDNDYIGADGIQRNTSRFANDTTVLAAPPRPKTSASPASIP